MKKGFQVDYLNYVFVVLVIGMMCLFIVRLATRSKNPDLLLQYEARKKTARKQSAARTGNNSDPANTNTAGQGTPVIKSLRDRHVEKTHYRTPWGWPSVERQSNPQGVSQAVRNFTDRLVKEKQVLQPGGSNAGNDSIRALLEDRYGPVNKDMTEIPYQKVKRPLLRDPSEQHDQLDNLGSAESRRLRQKLQFLSAMTNVEDGSGNAAKGTRKVEFRYVELKDLKQPWGW
jgi:hypothetical protein